MKRADDGAALARSPRRTRVGGTRQQDQKALLAPLRRDARADCKPREVFTLLEYEQTTAPSPATTGIKTQAAALLDKADSKLHNQIAVMSALGNEHFEISAYTGLVLLSESLKLADVAKLLQDNLDQEQHTSEELLSKLKELTQ